MSAGFRQTGPIRNSAMRYLPLLIISLAMSLLPATTQADDMSISAAQQQEAAQTTQTALDELIRIAPEINVKSIGFENEKQVREAKLGMPISEYLVQFSY